MEWFIAVIAIAALGVAAMAAAGGAGQMSNEPVYDTFRTDLPARPLAAEDLKGLRFGVAWRGYAMDQVDDLIDRLAAEIAERDARIAALTGQDGPDAAPELPTHEGRPVETLVAGPAPSYGPQSSYEPQPSYGPQSSYEHQPSYPPPASYPQPGSYPPPASQPSPA